MTGAAQGLGRVIAKRLAEEGAKLVVCDIQQDRLTTAARELREETGIAFQLTNILRDVKEDAERKRVYLPLDMLAQHGLIADDILARNNGTAPSDRELAVLTNLCQQLLISNEFLYVD